MDNYESRTTSSSVQNQHTDALLLLRPSYLFKRFLRISAPDSPSDQEKQKTMRNAERSSSVVQADSHVYFE